MVRDLTNALNELDIDKLEKLITLCKGHGVLQVVVGDLTVTLNSATVQPKAEETPEAWQPHAVDDPTWDHELGIARSEEEVQWMKEQNEQGTVTEESEAA